MDEANRMRQSHDSTRPLASESSISFHSGEDGATRIAMESDPGDVHCANLSRVNRTNFVISLILLLGIVVSYLPQHVRIINRRSSFGLSPYFVLLGVTSGTCAFANILVLPASRADLACCDQVSGFACFAGLLGMLQVGVQWTCFVVIWLLFLIFFPRATPADAHPDKDAAHPSFRTAIGVSATCVVHGILVLAFSLYFVLATPQGLQWWANFLGIFATVLASIQYFPQIYTTYLLRRVGSLSIPMMCLQTPGSFVWAASLAARLGAEGWSAWGVYCVTGCLQGTLLVMAIIFELQERNRQKDAPTIEDVQRDGEQAEEEATEQTPLIRAPG